MGWIEGQRERVNKGLGDKLVRRRRGECRREIQIRVMVSLAMRERDIRERGIE